MSDDMVYLGVKDCGCAVGIMVDVARHRDHLIETVTAWMRDGLSIERVTRRVGLDRFKQDCTHQEESRP